MGKRRKMRGEMKSDGRGDMRKAKHGKGKIWLVEETNGEISWKIAERRTKSGRSRI